MNYFAVFLLAFLLELTGAIYTVSLSRGKMLLTVVMSMVNASLSWGAVYLIVYDVQLLIPAVLGVTAGTVVALRINNKSNRPESKP